MFMALKFKVDHVTWPRPFQGQFVTKTAADFFRQKLNFPGKNSKIVFVSPLGGLGDNVHG